MVCGEFDDTQIFVSFEHKRNCTHLFDMTDPPQTTHICQSEDIYAVTGSPSLLTPFWAFFSDETVHKDTSVKCFEKLKV